MHRLYHVVQGPSELFYIVLIFRAHENAWIIEAFHPGVPDLVER
jgi:hypothetical protein